jgi:hypothetical protein
VQLWGIKHVIPDLWVSRPFLVNSYTIHDVQHKRAVSRLFHSILVFSTQPPMFGPSPFHTPPP